VRKKHERTIIVCWNCGVENELNTLDKKHICYKCDSEYWNEEIVKKHELEMRARKLAEEME
jgi:hypothetical protein